MGLLYIWRKKQRTVQEGAHVSLSGLGGDELFCGRFHHLADLFTSGRWGDLRREIRGVYPVDRSTGKRTSRLDLATRYVVAPLLPRSVKRFVRGRLLGETLVGPWIHPDLARRVGLEERLDQGPPRVYKDAYRQDCWEVFRYVLVELSLPIHEALGGALALDTRFPLLDRRLVEYMFAAPREGKIREGHSRILQRKAMEGILPEVVTREHLKKNFNPVLAQQQRANFERETLRLLDQKHLRSEAFIDWAYVRKIHADFLKGRADAWYPLWFALNLERWLEQNAAAPLASEG
jgi:asparagine synthase (glutamine-hydrolysing)